MLDASSSSIAADDDRHTCEDRRRLVVDKFDNREHFRLKYLLVVLIARQVSCNDAFWVKAMNTSDAFMNVFFLIEKYVVRFFRDSISNGILFLMMELVDPGVVVIAIAIIQFCNILQLFNFVIYCNYWIAIFNC